MRGPLAPGDLPVSRTGLTLHHSPRYQMEVQPGQFREEVDPGPVTAALRVGDPVRVGMANEPAPPPAAPPPTAAIAEKSSAGAGGGGAQPFGGLSPAREISRDGARVAAGVLPVRVGMPQFGKPLFAAAELTPENLAPSVDIVYRRTIDR